MIMCKERSSFLPNYDPDGRQKEGRDPDFISEYAVRINRDARRLFNSSGLRRLTRSIERSIRRINNSLEDEMARYQ